MFKYLIIFLSPFLLFSQNLKIASYNVENLFDMQNDGTEYKAYKPNRHNWTRKNFQKKLLNISEVICDINADIIALQEIENENVLKLLKQKLRKVGCFYRYSAITHKKKSAIQVAVLSKFPIQSVNELFVNKKLKYRNILEVKFIIDNETLYLFVNHWASKRNAESSRIVSAKVLKKRLLRLPKGSEYIVLGDFNNNYNEYLSMQTRHNNTKGRTAINHILKTINHENKFIRKKDLKLNHFGHYNLWLELENYKRWSHNFYGNKQALDAMLLPYRLFDGKGFDYIKDSFYVFKRKYLFHKKGYIFRWEYKKFKHRGRGYSDHLAIVAEFSTTEHFKLEKSLIELGSIDGLYSKNLSYPILLKKVKVLFSEKNKVLIGQKNANKKILIYGTKDAFVLNRFYDIMVYKIKKYKGQYEIIDFEIEKRYHTP
jgi:endonuclease/exonuclease/phosphatase family metal-dependent hydrolase